VQSFNDWPLRDLRTVIDWTPFFRAWELAGNYPAILTTKSSAKAPPRFSRTPRRCSTGSSPSIGWCPAPPSACGAAARGDDVLVLAGNDWTRLPFLRSR
jgi:5-methyltetrahydrofolate--homocysteine methyltransferase